MVSCLKISQLWPAFAQLSLDGQPLWEPRWDHDQERTLQERKAILRREAVEHVSYTSPHVLPQNRSKPGPSKCEEGDTAFQAGIQASRRVQDSLWPILKQRWELKRRHWHLQRQRRAFKDEWVRVSDGEVEHSLDNQESTGSWLHRQHNKLSRWVWKADKEVHVEDKWTCHADVPLHRAEHLDSQAYRVQQRQRHPRRQQHQEA